MRAGLAPVDRPPLPPCKIRPWYSKSDPSQVLRGFFVQSNAPTLSSCQDLANCHFGYGQGGAKRRPAYKPQSSAPCARPLLIPLHQYYWHLRLHFSSRAQRPRPFSAPEKDPRVRFGFGKGPAGQDSAAPKPKFSSKNRAITAGPEITGFGTPKMRREREKKLRK